MTDYLIPIFLIIIFILLIWLNTTPTPLDMSGDITRKEKEYKESLPGLIDEIKQEAKNFWK